MIKLVVNKKYADNHFNTIKNLLTRRISNVLRLGYVGRNPNRKTLSLNLRNYLNDLVLNEENLKNLIVSEAKNLSNIISSIEQFYPTFIQEGSNENLILRNIFISHGYENKEFNKLKFIDNINIDTCPYCNRNYIYSLSKVDGIKPQIDHFYPKSKFPFLALSFYNLIPSCTTCNGFDAKSNKNPFDYDLVNPYLIDYDNFTFSYNIKNINLINPLLDKNSVDVKFISKLDGNIEVFKLQKLYNRHTDHILELIIKSKIAYSEQYRNFLKSYKNFTFSDDEINRLIIGNYSKDNETHKRPFSKMYQDIAKELGLI